MNIELWGGPMDGHTMAVPPHVPMLKIPVPGSAWTPMATNTSGFAGMCVAMYARCHHVDGRVSYVYQGQERITT